MGCMQLSARPSNTLSTRIERRVNVATALVALMFIAFSASGLYAQGYGTISGTVIDPSGASVASATVKAIQTQTGRPKILGLDLQISLQVGEQRAGGRYRDLAEIPPDHPLQILLPGVAGQIDFELFDADPVIPEGGAVQGWSSCSSVTGRRMPWNSSSLSASPTMASTARRLRRGSMERKAHWSG